MNCPRCDYDALKVLESRAAEGGETIRRRRSCLECGHRFTTYERLERQPLVVEKADGHSEPFEREKMLYGLVRACSKREIPTERLEALVVDIEMRLRDRCITRIEAKELGELVLQGLRAIDEVAYVRFASVYRAFDSAEEFADEITRMRAERPFAQIETAPKSARLFDAKAHGSQLKAAANQ